MVMCNFLLGVWAIQPPALIKFSANSTPSLLKSSHYDLVHITFNDLPVI